jgi:N-terminal acetyltransferase B complex non-catalytic subunit
MKTPEMLVQAYRFGTFSKIPEFIRFRDRLTHSLQKVISEANQLSNDFIFEWTTFVAQEEAFKSHDFSALDKLVTKGKDEFSDNRDSKVIPQWSMGSKNAAEIILGSGFPCEEVLFDFSKTYELILTSKDKGPIFHALLARLQ